MKPIAYRIGVLLAACGLSLGAAAAMPAAYADPSVTLPPMTSGGGGPIIGGGSTRRESRSSCSALAIRMSKRSTARTRRNSSRPPPRWPTRSSRRPSRCCVGRWRARPTTPDSGRAPIDATTGNGEARCWSRPRAPHRTSTTWPAAPRPIGAGPRPVRKRRCATTAGATPNTYESRRGETYYILLAGTAADFCSALNAKYKDNSNGWPF